MMIIVLQNQYNQQYQTESQAAQNAYDNAMNFYNQASSNIETSYANAKATYQQQLNSYQAALKDYNNKVNGQSTIVSNGNTKLVGTAGVPGSIGYYSGMSVVSTDTGYTALEGISWNSNTSVIGTSKKANLENYQGKLADGNESDFYDITDVVHKNGTITLTNVTTDLYGINYDLKLGFTNTDSGTTAGHKSTVIIGPANDGSIEFDFYGGFETASAGVNISSMQFVYHGTNIVVPVFLNSLFADLDIQQSFNTNLGNVIAWTPSDSKISISGDNYIAPIDGFNGFSSTPEGTGVMVGKGSNFYYHFYNGSHNGFTPDVNIPGGPDSGTQFNLFGKGSSLAQSPTPPFPPSKQTIIPPTKQPVNQQHASATYHSNKVILN